MKSVFQLIASVACVFALTACGSAANDKKAVVIDPATQVKDLIVTDLTVGTGAAAAAGDTLIVTYTGWLYNSGKPDNKGTQFDATKPGAGFSVQLGKGIVIPGWDQGLVGMKVGGTRRLTIPSSLGYGPNGSPPTIPAYAGLVFDVTLVTLTPKS
ncbi:FKBP-type peptidyl-prolyl cis-trans isomerase [Janthinobacterium sp. PC23-8]|uniref:FKBP-type peptidyl-prolyl cis-trans isomerase n=1 Tax=Janthinobacterium sp. PC23-8 TaxID=2012679 RepID=UPI000B96F928|nr:FKBP-type peptidyl-prolyl cis-trans isomerase [Janthinobacterium sp. PC23-8]OYO31655.1 hypothetical protein CD932_11390 [Janthinobacterium sp. PC23-8]